MAPTIFVNYDPTGEVAQNAHPNTGVYQWIANKFVSPAGVNKLVTTNERRSWFVNAKGINPMAKPGTAGCGCGCNCSDTTK